MVKLEQRIRDLALAVVWPWDCALGCLLSCVRARLA